MDKALQDFVVEKTKELMAAESCSQEAKDAAQAWLDALGTPQEGEETKKYIQELEEDVLPIEACIAFSQSEAGIQLFGAELAKMMGAHAREVKAAGGKFCDCPACVAGLAILEKKAALLG